MDTWIGPTSWILGRMLVRTATAKSLQLCPTLCDPIDSSPPGSSIPGILQARTLEWVAISFSNAWKWKVKTESEVAQSCPTLSDPMDCSLPGSSIHGIFQARVLEVSENRGVQKSVRVLTGFIAFYDLATEVKKHHFSQCHKPTHSEGESTVPSSWWESERSIDITLKGEHVEGEIFYNHLWKIQPASQDPS